MSAAVATAVRDDSAPVSRVLANRFMRESPVDVVVVVIQRRGSLQTGTARIAGGVCSSCAMLE